MDKANQVFTDTLNFAREGFANANGLLGLLIAVIAVFMMSRYSVRTILTTTIGATIAYLLIQALVPVLDHNAPLRLPNILANDFWRQTGLLLVGLFIVISVLYLIKQTVLKSAGGGGGGGHH